MMKKNVILLICGSGVLMDITKKILKRAGYEVFCAESPAAAKEEIAKQAPDGIVLDSDLLNGNGIEYCKELRKESAAPVMIISNGKDDELPALKAGANDFLKKPFDCDVLKARLGVMTAGQKNTKINKKINIKQIYAAAAACLVLIFAGYSAVNSITDRIIPANAPAIEIPKKETAPEKDASEFVFESESEETEETKKTEESEETEEPLGSLNMFLAADEKAKAYEKPWTELEKRPDCLIPHYTGAFVSAVTGTADLALVNPEGNLYGLTFGITLEETGEILYASGLVLPGMCIEDFKFKAEALTNPGEYAANLTIGVYDGSTRAKISEYCSPFLITVK